MNFNLKNIIGVTAFLISQGIAAQFYVGIQSGIGNIQSDITATQEGNRLGGAVKAGYIYSLNTHFGIGQATTIDQVVIKWPSGVVDTFTNVTPNQVLNVVEGQTLGTNSFDSFVFTVYPNPATTHFTIKYEGVEVVNAQLLNLSGQVIREFSALPSGTTFNVADLQTGMYLLQMNRTTQRIVIN